MSQQIGLHVGSPKRANLFQKAFGLIEPLIIAGQLSLIGLPYAIWVQLKSLNPIKWLSPWAWRDALLAGGMGYLLRVTDEMNKDYKRELITKNAKGRIFELGSGTGQTLQYYDVEKIDTLFAIEPFPQLLPDLRKAITARGPNFEQKTKVVPLGIEDRQEMVDSGVEAGSFDTVVLVQVLCSIPNPTSHLAYLQSLLKSGGQLLVFEHVASSHPFTYQLQRLYGPFWGFLARGCQLHRKSAEVIQELGGWREVEIARPKDEHDASMFPHAVAKFVKA